VAKELVGMSQPEGSGQQLNIQMDTGDKWCPSGSVLGLVLFSIFNSGIARSSVPSARLQMTPS